MIRTWNAPWASWFRRFSRSSLVPHERTIGVEHALESSLSSVLSSRRPLTALLPPIAALGVDGQHFIVRWTPALARTSAELAWRFCQAAPEALRALTLEVAEEWVAAALALHDRQGIAGACRAIEDWQSFALRKRSGAVRLDDVVRTLRHILQALGAETMQIASGPRACIRDETVFLPECIDSAGTREQNALHYKATLLMLWAQIRFGTFEANLESEIGQYANADRALDTFNSLETVRLDASLGRLFPGLHRDLASLRVAGTGPLPFPRLYAPDSHVHDSLDALAICYADPPLTRMPYLATIDRSAQILRASGGKPPQSDAVHDSSTAEGKAGTSDEAQHESETDAEPPGHRAAVAAPYTWASSIVPPGVRSETPESPAMHAYDEWDCSRSQYRKSWCTVREIELDHRAPDGADEIVARAAPTIRALRRCFERLTDCNVLERRQPEGDELDLDAYLDAWIAARRGDAVTPLAFTRRIRAARDLATLIMVDMSGSTQGWINEAEREALIVLCEALGTLDNRASKNTSDTNDAYAIYGFSGLARDRCEIYPLKRFEEAYGVLVRERIAAITPRDYTRMGAAVRHLSRHLESRDAHTRLLLVISDGRPDDYSDGYRGEYAIEDTRQALNEARAAGVRTFCVTLDRDARDYLPRLYGRSAWAVVENVATLPTVLASVYGKLTH